MFAFESSTPSINHVLHKTYFRCGKLIKDDADDTDCYLETTLMKKAVRSLTLLLEKSRTEEGNGSLLNCATLCHRT